VHVRFDRRSGPGVGDGVRSAYDPKRTMSLVEILQCGRSSGALGMLSFGQCRRLASVPPRFRTIKICPKDAACVWRHSRPVNGGIPLEQRKGHVMSDMTLKTDRESQGWTRPSDIAWAVGYLIVTILLVLVWTNVPA
jgi:hypothetical protein